MPREKRYLGFSATGRPVRYIRSTFTGGSCVEVAYGEDGIYVRNSRKVEKPPLIFTQSEWMAFLQGVQRGEFEIERLRSIHDEFVVDEIS